MNPDFIPLATTTATTIIPPAIILPAVVNPPLPPIAIQIQPPTAASTPTNLILATQVSTLYIGKIPSSLDEEVVKKLLEACGAVKLWRRVRDPKTGSLKGFGFCDFENPEGVSIAETVLADPSTVSFDPDDGGERKTLLVKADDKAQKQIEAFYSAKRDVLIAQKVRDELERRSHMPPGMEDTSEIGNQELSVSIQKGGCIYNAVEKDMLKIKNDLMNASKAKVIEILNEWRSKLSKNDSSRDTNRSASPDSREKLIGTSGNRVSGEKASEIGREIAAWKERTSRNNEANIPPMHTRRISDSRASNIGNNSNNNNNNNNVANALDESNEERNRRIQREIEKERERERKERNDRLFREAEKDYEIREKDRIRRLNLLDAAARELLNNNNNNNQSTKIKRSRGERDAEKREDEEDRKREKEELRLLKEKEELEMKRRAIREKEEAEMKAKKEAEEREREQQELLVKMDLEQRAKGAYGTFLPSESLENGFKIAFNSNQIETQNVVMSNSPSESTLNTNTKTPTPTTTKTPTPTTTTTTFQMEEIMEVPKKKKLILLDEPPQQQQQQATTTTTNNALNTQQQKGKHQQEPKKKGSQKQQNNEMQAIVQQIPTLKKDVFAWKVDWNVVDSNNIIEQRMRPWVAKKILEYLGEEEHDLIEFVVKQLVEHAKPETVLQQLKLILEDEAELFVLKLWRMLIFEVLSVTAKH